ncbi:MAG TPA: 5-formyltetrahydrofolate cyclo-ligase [Gammaproteobacteria bacterium]|nr:5-formyltetrahydrofolate cyclo-ligase [Gammaproteobacteria bacterium]
MSSPDALRQQIRQARRQIPARQRLEAIARFTDHVAHSEVFRRAHAVAFYLPNDGEMDLRPLMQLAWQQGRQCYLPVVGMPYENRLWFMPWTPDTPLAPNRFGIPEPTLRRHLRWYRNFTLDLALVPLVAFDAEGHRLGMGGGYYDRSFAYLRHRRHWCRPHLMGAAFALQEVPSLQTRPWDVPLNSVVTEDGLRRFPRD